jgi:hypothetical protein
MIILLIELDAKEFTTYKAELQNLDFSNSTQKREGKRYNFAITQHIDRHKMSFYYSKTKTDTYKPPLPRDLDVDKYSFLYSYQLKENLSLKSSYITIDDNLVKTDGGHIYGLGTRYKNINFMQFFSNYHEFDIYQSDLSVGFKQKLANLNTKTVFIAKYLNLKDHKSNPLSKNAQKDYLTIGINLHTFYRGYHGGVGAYFGKRVFAVMEEGLKVQHHGMEFESTYMLSIGKKMEKYNLGLKYIHMKATELPKLNEGVIVRNLIFTFEIRL